MTAVEVRPITPGMTADLQAFSRINGRFGYCSCMKWRMPSTRFKNSTRQERAAELDTLVESGDSVGLLAYQDDRPIGWTSLGRRGEFPALVRSRTLPPVDDDVWVVLCFYVAAGTRGSGVQHAMLEAAVGEARARGGSELVGYPVRSDAKLYRYMGSFDVFNDLGFEDITPPGAPRLVMRREL